MSGPSKKPFWIYIWRLLMAYSPNHPHGDEPFFALLGRDEVAPIFARAYGYYLQGHATLAQQEIARAGEMMSRIEPLPANHPKVRSCFDMAEEMTDYHRTLVIRHGVG